MGEIIRNVLLASILLMLVAIVASIYIPAIRIATSGLPPPTRQDFEDARAIQNSVERREAIQALRLRTPVVRIDGGSVSVSGSVDVDNTVTVEALEDKERREMQDRVRLNRAFEAWSKQSPENK
ncbi:hypothetical protein ABD76_24775 [Paenibacillus dendritiformis]|nr:hypothetical protein [Paenibacillus dendritiformis]MBG9795498.1 hypothetical protein [Paenibacillus dendritiformis]